MGQLAQQFSTDIQKALKADELDLPTLPEVALRIRDEAQFKNVSATSLAKVIAEDPGLAAQLVRTANSPMFMAALIGTDPISCASIVQLKGRFWLGLCMPAGAA